MRVLLMMEKGQDAGPLGRMVMASDQVAQVFCQTEAIERETEAYDACRDYVPDLVLVKGQAKGLKKICTDLRMKALVIDGEAKAPVYCSASTVAEFRRRKRPNLLLIYEAVDPSEFFCQNLPRNITVSSPPHEYVDFLVLNGIKVLVMHDMAPWQVRDALNRSKISLNFTRDHFKITSCGAMMLDAGTEAGEFYQAPNEMAVFRSKEDLLKKVQFYLRKLKRRETVARAGRKKSEIWSVWNCWGHAFERMGFPKADFLVDNKEYETHCRLVEEIEGR